MSGGGEHLKDEVWFRESSSQVSIPIYDVGFETAGNDCRSCCRARVKVRILQRKQNCLKGSLA